MPVKLMGRLPDGERNALADLAERLADAPHDELCVIVTLRPKSTEVDVDGDDEITVKLRILDIEVIEGLDRGFVEAAARSAREQRTGRRSLPGFTVPLPDVDVGDLVARWKAEDAAARDIDADGEITDPADDGTVDVALPDVPPPGAGDDDDWETPPRDPRPGASQD